MIVSRGYRWVGDRWVHWRFAGKGPLVVLLHGSPQSGAAVAGVMGALVEAGCAALALDNPGNGLSDGLHGDPEDADAYGDALAVALDALGVKRAAFYGFHTGAVHAAAFAARHPHRVSALALDGFPIWTPEERADLLSRYLPPFLPSWDGAHLTWAWARMEAQSVFFPWYAQHEAARMPLHAVPDAAVLHEGVLDLLRAGDRYRAPYASAFRADGAGQLAALTQPLLLCAGARDPLAAHLDRVAPGCTAEIRRHPAERQVAWTDIARWLAARTTGETPSMPDSGVDSAGMSRRFVCGRRVYTIGAGRGRPLVLQHGAGASLDAMLKRLVAAGRPVLAIERPLHGESGDDDADLIATLGWGDAEAVADRDLDPPDLTPSWDGAHLTAAWRFAWRSALHDPWNRPDAAHARPGAPDIAAIHATASDLLRWRPLRTAPTPAPGR